MTDDEYALGIAGVPAGRRHQAIAEALLAAEIAGAPIDPVSNRWPQAGVRDAYAVQLLGVSARVAAGAAVVGHKIGLTSQAMRRQVGVEDPTYGHLLDRMLVADGDTISLAELIVPRVEAEVAFVLGSPLRGPGVSPRDVTEATDHLLPAIEVLDSRIAGRPRLVDTIVDNASAARIVLGTHRTRPTEIDLDAVAATMTLNGQVVQRATTGTDLEHAAAAVAWLANVLAERDVFMDAGHVILSGARSGAVRVSAGDEIRMTVGELGSVGVRFVE